MGAISSEIVHLLKVNALKMTREYFSCFIGFQNFPGEDPQPPSRSENMRFYCQSSTAQHKPLVQSEVFKLGRENKSNFLLICDNWVMILLA